MTYYYYTKFYTIKDAPYSERIVTASEEEGVKHVKDKVRQVHGDVEFADVYQINDVAFRVSKLALKGDDIEIAGNTNATEENTN